MKYILGLSLIAIFAVLVIGVSFIAYWIEAGRHDEAETIKPMKPATLSAYQQPYYK